MEKEYRLYKENSLLFCDEERKLKNKYGILKTILYCIVIILFMCLFSFRIDLNTPSQNNGLSMINIPPYMAVILGISIGFIMKKIYRNT